MKKLWRFGDRRKDGYYFVNYEKTQKYGFYEKWASPERWLKIKEYQRQYQVNRRRKNRKRAIA